MAAVLDCCVMSEVLCGPACRRCWWILSVWEEYRCLIRLVEDLVPYMDASVHDAGGAQLAAAGHLKRKRPLPPESLPQVRGRGRLSS